jgi:hypothetical protein
LKGAGSTAAEQVHQHDRRREPRTEIADRGSSTRRKTTTSVPIENSDPSFRSADHPVSSLCEVCSPAAEGDNFCSSTVTNRSTAPNLTSLNTEQITSPVEISYWQQQLALAVQNKSMTAPQREARGSFPGHGLKTRLGHFAYEANLTQMPERCCGRICSATSNISSEVPQFNSNETLPPGAHISQSFLDGNSREDRKHLFNCDEESSHEEGDPMLFEGKRFFFVDGDMMTKRLT